MKVLLLLASLGAAAAAQGTAPTASPADEPAVAAAEPMVHAAFTELLGRFVKGGLVDYAGLASHRAALDAYLDDLGRTDPATLGKADRMAFWINAYNAFTLALILDHYPDIDSIKDIPASERWKARRWPVSGAKYSLDQIEHEILRPMGDARIHFAVNCASTSCPDMREEAYEGAHLDAQLDDAARRFLDDTDKGLRTATERGFFGGTDHNVYVSKIFDWFEEDFERDAGDVVSYVRRFAPEDAVRYIDAHRDDLDVEHLDYDWSLNDV